MNQAKQESQAYYKITGNRNRYLSSRKPPKPTEVIVGHDSKQRDTVRNIKLQYPRTSNMEYGWAWSSKPLEI
jgi:hypothetical protein